METSTTKHLQRRDQEGQNKEPEMEVMHPRNREALMEVLNFMNRLSRFEKRSEEVVLLVGN